MTKAKASDEGAAAQSIAEEAQGVPPGAETTLEPVTPTPDLMALAAAMSAPPTPAPIEPGLPSPHQNHSLNWVSEAQIKYDTFRAGHGALVTELEGKEQAYEAARKEREVQFTTDETKRKEKHGEEVADLARRIEDMRVGMEISNAVVNRYNEIIQPETKNIRDDEQQESEQ